MQRSPRATAKTVNLAHKVPVAWVYFTGWVTRDDIVHFRDDVYDHDDDDGEGVGGSPRCRPPRAQAGASCCSRRTGR